MTILVTGGNGQLGQALASCRRRDDLGARLVVLPRRDLDITDEAAIKRAMIKYQPRIVINAAAWTEVDGAESHVAQAHLVNATAPGILAGLCRDSGSVLLHISTDFVFSGPAARPWREDDPIAPACVYGESKAQGEAEIRAACPHHLIIRTAWLYGVGGRNFVTAILRAGAEREMLRVVEDQLGCPTSCGDLAEAILSCCATILAHPAGEVSQVIPWGIYHAVNGGAASWHAFAGEIIARARALPMGAQHLRVKAIWSIPTKDWPTPAVRPVDSRLDCTRLREAFGVVLRPWQEALDHWLPAIIENLWGDKISASEAHHD